jgi:hypothetical protein
VRRRVGDGFSRVVSAAKPGGFSPEGSPAVLLSFLLRRPRATTHLGPVPKLATPIPVVRSYHPILAGVLSRSAGGEAIATFPGFTAPGIYLDELRLEPILRRNFRNDTQEAFELATFRSLGAGAGGPSGGQERSTQPFSGTQPETGRSRASSARAPSAHSRSPGPRCARPKTTWSTQRMTSVAITSKPSAPSTRPSASWKSASSTIKTNSLSRRAPKRTASGRPHFFR